FPHPVPAEPPTLSLPDALPISLLSQMALLRADTGWEKWIVPAFVYFFAQLYPFRQVGRPRARTAAAAGGCMLVRRDVLAAAGGGAGGPTSGRPALPQIRVRLLA